MKKYPKFFIFLLTILAAQQIFVNKDYVLIQNLIQNSTYIAAFIIGIMYVYTFTAIPAASLLLILSQQPNLLLIALMLSLGSLTGDLMIFKLIRTSFRDEIKNFKKEKLLRKLKPNLRRYIKYIAAGLMIASPFPDEIGIIILAAEKIKTKTFVLISYLLNTAGIIIILLIGKNVL